MSDSKLSTFTVSDLPKISSISHDDLLMVSDYDGGKCYTRKMQLQQLYETIADDSIISSAVLDAERGLGRAIDIKVSSELQDRIKEEVERAIISELSSKVLKIIKDNYQTVWDYFDGVQDSQTVIQG